MIGDAALYRTLLADGNTTSRGLRATAARRLPLAEREIILLHDFAAISLERAAASLGCARGAAKVRLHRARRRLAELCRAECTSDEGPDGTTLCSPTTREVAPATLTTGQRRNVRKRRK